MNSAVTAASSGSIDFLRETGGMLMSQRASWDPAGGHLVFRYSSSASLVAASSVAP